MTTMKKTISKFSMIFVLALILGAASAFAADAPSAETDILSLDAGMQVQEVYHFPTIPATINVGAGYRYVDNDDSNRTPFMEYQPVDSSPVYSLDARIFRYPDRFMAHGLYGGPDDFFIDASYAYSNLFLIRGISTGIWHNLENIRMRDPEFNPLLPRSTDGEDSTHNYGIATVITRVNARLKMPDFPAHMLLEYMNVNKDGDRQQRFSRDALLMSTAASNPTRNPATTTSSDKVDYSRERSVKMITQNYGAGINSHLGPIEVQYMYNWKTLGVDGEDVMYDTYTSATASGGGGARAAGIWPHNRISEIEGGTHTLQLHTNYTGQLVGAATLSKGMVENQYSTARAETSYYAGSLAWQPARNLAFTAKYRYREIDKDIRESMTAEGKDSATGAALAPYSNDYIRNTIDTKNYNMNFQAKYRPLNWLTLRGGYMKDRVERAFGPTRYLPTDDTAAENFTRRMQSTWYGLEPNTTKTEWNAGFDLAITKRYKAKFTYVDTHYTHPAYNNQPDDADTYKGVLTMMPLPTIYAILGYDKTYEKRKGLFWPELEAGNQNGEEKELINKANNRDVTKDHGTAILTWTINPTLILSGHYAFFNNETDQDLIHTTGLSGVVANGTTIITDPITGLPLTPNAIAGNGTWSRPQSYESFVTVYGGNVSYSPSRTVQLNAGLTWVNTESTFKFNPKMNNLVGSMTNGYVQSISKVKSKDMTFSLNANMAMGNHFLLGLDYKYNDYEDEADNGYSGFEDSQVHLVLLTLKKEFAGGL